MTKDIAGHTYYSAPEAADKVGVSRQTMCRWVKTGEVQAFQHPISGHYYIPEAVVTELRRRLTPSVAKEEYSG